jgi:uncharacterized membrane protein YeiH
MAVVETILTGFGFLGTAVFAVSGALLGLRKSMDVIGISFVATVTGVGGGTIRDLLLGATPVAWVSNPTDIIICIVCAIFVSLLNSRLDGRRMQWLLYADAAGLALFAVVGAAIAQSAGAHPLVAILFGAMSASFGGIIRDTICGEPPILFSKELYITPALLGAAIFILAPENIGFDVRAISGFGAALALRLLAIRFGWAMPFPRYTNS